MQLKERKEHILRLIKLGMELYKASLVAGCSEEEIEQLENDKVFKLKIEAYKAISEKELLDRLEDAMDIAVDRGNSSAIQWKLERLNPKKWGSKEMDRDFINPNITIELAGRHSNDKDS